MESSLLAPRDVFPMQLLAHYIDAYQPPDGPFDPNGAWTQQYDVLTLTGAAPAVGRLELQRTPNARGGAELAVNYEKLAPGGSVYITEGEVTMGGDVLSMPSAWRYSGRIDQQGVRRAPRAALTKKGWARENVVHLEVDGQKTAYPYEGSLAMNWALFDAVQRMDAATPPRHFTLLDHFEELKSGHTLSYRGEQVLRIGGRESYEHTPRPLEKGTLHETTRVVEEAFHTEVDVFQQLGRGIVPIVFWRDKAGRVLFVVSGIEGYVLRNPGEEA